MTKMKNSHQFFRNTDCVYFPCHEGVAREHFNCLFCYCPLYHWGDQCGGNFEITPKNVKCCVKCTIPHEWGNYDYIVEKLKQANRRDACSNEQESTDLP